MAKILKKSDCVSLLRRFAGLKVTCVLLVAFLLLTFWGTLGQAAVGNEGAALAAERYFGSYFIWLLGVVPLPAFKSLAVLSVFHLLCSLIWRIPFGVRSVGLYMIHGGLLVLLLGSLIGSEIKGEYVGFSMDENPTVFFDVGDETRATPVAVAESFAYVVRYQGEIQMGDKSVEMYQAFYDPFHFVPYLAMVMFIFGAALHYVLKCRKKIGGGGVLNSVPAMAVAVLPLLASTFACSAETPSLCRALPAKSALVVLEEGVRPYDSFARGVLDDFSGKVRYYCGVDDS